MLMQSLFANIAIFVSLITYVYFGNPFTARRVFVVTAYMQLLYTWSVFFWSHAIQVSAEALVSIGRIEEFLLLPESKTEMELLEQSKDKKRTLKEEEALIKQSSEVQRRKSEIQSAAEWGSDIAFFKRRILRPRLEEKQSPEIVFRKATAAWMRANKKGSDTGKIQVT